MPGISFRHDPQRQHREAVTVISIRIFPRIKEVAKKAAAEAKTYLFKYLQNLIDLDS